jgi:hypothetical protein
MSSPTKLIIDAYESQDYSGNPVGSYTAQVNPSSYSVDRTLNPTAGALRRSQGSLLSTMKFEMLFDGTGVIESPGGEPFNVAAELSRFESVVYSFDGKIHRPHHLQIVWGPAPPFKCVLTSLSITYKLFDIEGSPLRALVNVNFASVTPQLPLEVQNVRPVKELLHVATVQAGDTLPQVTARVYGDARYYLQVAKYNSIINIRSLKPGQQIKFPPLT